MLLFILSNSYFFNIKEKLKKISTGATCFGLGTLSWNVIQAKKREKELAIMEEARRRRDEAILNQVSGIQDDVASIREIVQQIRREQNKPFSDKIKDLFSGGRRNHLDNGDDTSIFDNIIDILKDYSDFLTNLNYIDQVILINLFALIIISQALITIVCINYSQYIIERFQLETRFPKVAIFLRYRAKVQYLSRMWQILSIVLAFSIVFTIDILMLLRII